MCAIMKILHVIDNDGLYGAEIMLLNLMEEQQRMGLTPVLLNICDLDGKENVMHEEIRKRKLTAIQFNMKRGYSLKSALKVVRMAREAKITIIHSHGYKGDILIGSLPKHIRNVPMVRTQHGRTSTKTLSKIWLYEIVDKLILQRIDAVVQVNNSAPPRGNGLDREGAKNFIIENGIPELRFDSVSAFQSDPAVREFCKDSFVIGTICRLSEEKGLVHLIVALQMLSAHYVNFKVVVIGEGPQRRSLEAMISDAGLSHKIMLAGYRNSAYHYLPNFNVFVLPSLTEGLPITILEAMQAEVPIIATRVGGIPAVLENGRLGILIKPEDPKALADAITHVWSDPIAAVEIGKNARKVAITKYSSRRMAEDYMRVYETILRKWRN
jgi:glycosyltransferase involved in cell wall biosynthesis